MERWVDPALHATVLRHSDADGWGRANRWSPGRADIAPSLHRTSAPRRSATLEASWRGPKGASG